MRPHPPAPPSSLIPHPPPRAVRNRSRELAELLSDVEKIRVERRKAKANKSKYIGTGSDGLSFASGGSRYGGFGSDSLGGGGGGSYGGSASGFERGECARDCERGGRRGRLTDDRPRCSLARADYSGGSGGGAGGSSGFRDDTARRGYEEYDAGEYESGPRRSNSLTVPAVQSQSRAQSQSQARGAPARSATQPPVPVQKAPEVDLLGFADDESAASVTATAAGTAGFSMAGSTEKALPALATLSLTDGASSLLSPWP